MESKNKSKSSSDSEKELKSNSSVSRKSDYERRERGLNNANKMGNSENIGEKERYNKGFRYVETTPLPILICVSNDYYNSILETNYKIFKKIQEKTNVYKLSFDFEIQIPGSNQRVIKIFDRFQEKKNKASDMLVRDYLKNFLGQEKDCWITLLIPEGIVALFIGKKGNSIKNLMDDCKTKITVNQPIKEVTYRTVEIEGHLEDVIYSCKAICKAQEKISKKKNVNDFEVKPKNVSLNESKITVKFILHREICDFLDSNNGRFLNELCQSERIKIHIENGFEYKVLEDDERVLNMRGYLINLENSIFGLSDKIYHAECSMNHPTLKMLIPNNYVTKLIGQNGSMIRELAAKSRGAQIKILSNKNTERDLRDCVVTINGSVDNKREAALLIVRQIEIFKHGGPLLSSGKVLGLIPGEQIPHSNQAKEVNKFYDHKLEKRQRIDSFEDNHHRNGKYVKNNENDFAHKSFGYDKKQ
jgi:hypothetical protein